MNKDLILPEPGQWVRFVREQFIGKDNIIVSGMLGVVQPDPYGICIVGVDTMIRPTGAKEVYGYLNASFEILGDEPSSQEIEQSVTLWTNAFSEFEKRQGWTGLLKLGKKLVTQEFALTEIVRQLDKMLELSADKAREKEAKGAKKRISKVLKAFHNSPAGVAAAELADKLHRSALLDDELKHVCRAILAWVESYELVTPDVGESGEPHSISDEEFERLFANWSLREQIENSLVRSGREVFSGIGENKFTGIDMKNKDGQDVSVIIEYEGEYAKIRIELDGNVVPDSVREIGNFQDFVSFLMTYDL